jgi:hypothetical protein
MAPLPAEPEETRAEIAIPSGTGSFLSRMIL